MNESEKKIDGYLWDKAKMAISVFLAGSGLVMWLISTVFNPQTETKQDIALIKQDVRDIRDDIRAFTDRVAQDEKEYRQISDRMVKVETTLKLE